MNKRIFSLQTIEIDTSLPQISGSVRKERLLAKYKRLPLFVVLAIVCIVLVLLSFGILVLQAKRQSIIDNIDSNINRGNRMVWNTTRCGDVDHSATYERFDACLNEDMRQRSTSYPWFLRKETISNEEITSGKFDQLLDFTIFDFMTMNVHYAELHNLSCVMPVVYANVYYNILTVGAGMHYLNVGLAATAGQLTMMTIPSLQNTDAVMGFYYPNVTISHHYGETVIDDPAVSFCIQYYFAQ